MQTQEKIAKRAMVLSTLVCRGFIDTEKDPSSMELQKMLLPWLEEMDAAEELEEHEREVLLTSLGELKMQVHLNLVWVVEALATLAWALKRTELPVDDALSDPQAVVQKLYFLSTHAKKLFDQELQEEAVLEEELDAVLSTLKQTHKLVQNPATFTEELSVKNSIAIERARMLTWLLSTEKEYSEVQIDPEA